MSEPQPRQRRRDARVKVDLPVTCEKIVEMDQKLDPALAKVYERVSADTSGVGDRFDARLRDLSVNGAFIEGVSLPLLSRVAMLVEVPDWKSFEAVGWVLWRRTGPCTLQGPDGEVHLAPGFGVVFEWVSLESRLEIARRVATEG